MVPATVYSLDDIISHGEIIMLTVSGPETYYEYHGHGLGSQFLLCEDFAGEIGVKVRAEVCKDSTEMITKLREGKGDIIANTINATGEDLRNCGPGWIVSAQNTSLAERLDEWYSPDKLKTIKGRQQQMLANGGVQRHVYSPMLNRAQGVISKYDDLFMRYAPAAGLDWRLMAAQCYQESCFDPNAHSWAGACGLMQIIPSTAAHLGLPSSDMYSPEPNVRAAAKLMGELLSSFRDVPNPDDRLAFALAAYNAGAGHVRDAMALARRDGRNDKSWSQVGEYILKLQQPEYYTSPVVRNGYMRGSETYNYVRNIMQRWAQYRGVASSVTTSSNVLSGGGPSGMAPIVTPHRSRTKILRGK